MHAKWPCCRLHPADGKNKTLGAWVCVRVCLCKSLSAHTCVRWQEEGALTLALLIHLWWQSEKDQEPRLPPPSCLHPTIPKPFCPFPGLSLKNYRITLLQSLSKHRQIPHQPWPLLWQDDPRCTATGSVRCPSEQSPPRNHPICPTCINCHSFFDKHVFLQEGYFEVLLWLGNVNVNAGTLNLLEGIWRMTVVIYHGQVSNPNHCFIRGP